MSSPPHRVGPLARAGRRLGPVLPKSRFMRRLAMLSGSFALGQGLILLSSPILTRLFSPEEFGLYAVFTGLSGLLAGVLLLRYEVAIPIVAGEAEAADMAALSLLAGILVTALLFPAVWLGGGRLAAATGMPGLATLLWFLPPATFLLALSQLLSYWSIHRGTFRLNAASKIVQSTTQAGLQVGLGLAGAGAALGLVGGYALGYGARSLHLLLALPRADRAALRRVRLGAMLRLAREHWHYPAYSAPSTLLQGVTQLLPTLLLAILYGPAVAGWFGLGQRLMALPLRLFGQAASQVFLGEVGQRDAQGIYRLFKRASWRFLALGLLGMAPLLVAGPPLFALLFGEDWRVAGEMVRLLVPLYLVRFVVAPVSQTLNVFRRQGLHLLSSLLDGTALVLSFGAAWWLTLPPLTTILLYSLGSTLAYLCYFAMAWQVARSRAGVSAVAAPVAAADPATRIE